MNKNKFWISTLAMAMVALAGCEAEEKNPDESNAAAKAPDLSVAIEQRGEPCTCVMENMEAMTGLIESLESVETLSSQELNFQISEMILPCMKPTGDAELDRAYARAMGKCEDFGALTDIMTQVKNEVQARIQQEAEKEQLRTFEGAEGANAVLDRLKSGS